MIEIASLSPLGIYRVFFGSKLKYLKLDEVIEQLKSGKTLIRWGDGETALARKKDIWFQTSNLSISKKLNEFWLNDNKDIIFSLPRSPIEGTIFKYLSQRGDFFKEFSSRVYFSKKYYGIKYRVFADTYIWYNNYAMLKPVLIELSNNKKTLLVASDVDVFNNLQSYVFGVDFLQIPKKEIFNEKDSLVANLETWINANQGADKPVILLAAGPIGKLIACEMHKYAQFIDIGHGFALELGKEIIIVERD
jgi:hypothetical protein